MQMWVKVAAVIAALLSANIAAAQGTVWLQIEARPNETLASQRANDYATRLPDVSGFRLSSGWFAIALGPYSEDEARARLSQLRLSRAIPGDSFVSDGRNFRSRFYGAENTALVAPELSEPLEPLVPGEETVADARASERNLTREDREMVQIALRWESVYNSVIDSDFGAGTRRAMAAWQQLKRYEPTGVLTTLQRQELVDGYTSVLRDLDMRRMNDATAGIEIALPAGLVEFDRYEPPFAHYQPKTDAGVKVILISQSGDRDTLAAMFDILQTLEIVPLNGARELGRNEFTLTGTNEKIVSHTYARLDGDDVKGFTLIWPADDEKRRRLALSEMEATFISIPGAVLPDTVGDATQNIDLLAGLEIRRPERSRSGFYVDQNGGVLTTSEAVRQCTRITLNDETEADVAAEDTVLGLAYLRPRQTLAPISVARLASVEPRLLSDIAIAGYSYGGVLTAPSLTYGTLADVKGLDGDARVQRLDVAAQPGDAGGPVFDGSGAVMGMLLDRAGGTRQLPEGVNFAADAPVLAEFLSANGGTAFAADPGEPMAPEDLTLLAADMTVLVSCWN